MGHFVKWYPTLGHFISSYCILIDGILFSGDTILENINITGFLGRGSIMICEEAMLAIANIEKQVFYTIN